MRFDVPGEFDGPGLSASDPSLQAYLASQPQGAGDYSVYFPAPTLGTGTNTYPVDSHGNNLSSNSLEGSLDLTGGLNADPTSRSPANSQASTNTASASEEGPTTPMDSEAQALSSKQAHQGTDWEPFSNGLSANLPAGLPITPSAINAVNEPEFQQVLHEQSRDEKYRGANTDDTSLSGSASPSISPPSQPGLQPDMSTVIYVPAELLNFENWNFASNPGVRGQAEIPTVSAGAESVSPNILFSPLQTQTASRGDGSASFHDSLGSQVGQLHPTATAPVSQVSSALDPRSLIAGWFPTPQDGQFLATYSPETVGQAIAWNRNALEGVVFNPALRRGQLEQDQFRTSAQNSAPSPVNDTTQYNPGGELQPNFPHASSHPPVQEHQPFNAESLPGEAVSQGSTRRPLRPQARQARSSGHPYVRASSGSSQASGSSPEQRTSTNGPQASGETRTPRPRRMPWEINKAWVCSHHGCPLSYADRSHLVTHRNQVHGFIRGSVFTDSDDYLVHTTMVQLCRKMDQLQRKRDNIFEEIGSTIVPVDLDLWPTDTQALAPAMRERFANLHRQWLDASEARLCQMRRLIREGEKRQASAASEVNSELHRLSAVKAPSADDAAQLAEIFRKMQDLDRATAHRAETWETIRRDEQVVFIKKKEERRKEWYEARVKKAELEAARGGAPA